jgi:hypothetical protein
MTHPIAETMSEASPTHHHQTAPKRGERFRCQECGMEIQVTADCRCGDHANVHFECCGQEMARV